MVSIKAIVRGATTCVVFALFGIGALLLAPIVLLLRQPDRGQPVIRSSWRFAVALFVGLRLIRIDCGGVVDLRGAIIAANHPSLIDVVLLTVLVPHTLYVAKSSLKGNLFLSAIVRATALPNDSTLPHVAAKYLADGWNVLIFPEGTRTPLDSRLGDLHRGVAQIALKCGVPIVAAGISCSRRILGKRQRPWDMGTSPVTYRIRFAEPFAPVVADGECVRAAAMRVTSELGERIGGLL